MSTFGRPGALNVSRTTSKRGQAVKAKSCTSSADEAHAHEVAGNVGLFLEDARRADAALDRLRQRERHVVVAEVREELGRGVELVRVPSVVGRDAQLREPLGAEKVVVLPARARHGARKPALPVHAKDERLAGRDRPRQRDRDERPVVGIAVVRREILQRRRQIGAVLEGDAVDLGKAPPARLLRAHRRGRSFRRRAPAR